MDWLRLKVDSRIRAKGARLTGLASALGINRATLYGYLANPNKMQIGFAKKMAEVLAVDFDWLRNETMDDALAGIEGLDTSTWGDGDGDD